MSNIGPPLLYWQYPQQMTQTERLPGVQEHPTQPLFYFNTFIPYLSPEYDFNIVRYYKHSLEASTAQGQAISDQEIRDEITAGLNVRKICPSLVRVMKLPNGAIRPAYVPLLNDLNGYLHKGVYVFAKWLYKNHDFEEGELIPKVLVPIMDLKPSFEAEKHPTYTLPTTEGHVFFGAETNSLHVMKVLTKLNGIHLKVFSCVSHRSGVRYYRMTVRGDYKINDPGRVPFPERGHVVFWNGRDIHRDSFKASLREIYDRYNPFIILITEARPRMFQAADVMRNACGNFQMVISGNCGVGGVALLWNKVVQPCISTRSADMNALNLEVEFLAGPSLKPPTPPSDEHYESSDDDYDYIGQWLIDSGLDDDPSIHDEGWC